VEKANTYVGLDVHKESIDVALAEEGAIGEVRHFGTIGGDLEAVAKLVRRLRRKGRELKFVYEAGPCGFEVYRFLREQGLSCAVVSPSQVPRRAGDRIKTDRRDSESLARLYRAGELSAVYVPEPEDEAIRDLARAREDIRRGRQKARQQVQALLLRHGKRYAGKCAWTKAHRRWLCDLTLDHAAQKIALEEYLAVVDEATSRLERIERSLAEQAASWRFAPIVAALQALRGIDTIAAINPDHRARRSHPLQLATAADGLSRPRPLGALDGQQAPARRHHQMRQRACAKSTDRGRLGLSPSGAHRASLARSQRSVARRDPSDRVEGATPSLDALPPARRASQTASGRRHRPRARARRLRLGHRSRPGCSPLKHDSIA
jgi:hypothetical protein